MAFTTQQFTQSGVPIQSYNVDWVVGAGGVNPAVDVKLVQALLRMAFYQLPPHPTLKPPAGADIITVDGIAGPMTRKHIMAFQQAQKAHGLPTLVDGRMDPFRNQGELSHLAKVYYSLEKLNDYCFNMCKANDVNWHQELTLQPYVKPHTDLVKSLTCGMRTVAKQYQYQAPQTVPSTGGA